jgi:hypothetical protein
MPDLAQKMSENAGKSRRHSSGFTLESYGFPEWRAERRTVHSRSQLRELLEGPRGM